jgi:hypothetical protein
MGPSISTSLFFSFSFVAPPFFFRFRDRFDPSGGDVL